MKPVPCALALLLAMPCACERTNTRTSDARAATNLQATDCQSEVGELLRQRDEADGRLLAARDGQRDERARADLLQHRLDSLQERDGFEDMIWSRLEQAAIREQWVRDRLARASRAERPAIQASLKDADTARESLQQGLRRVRSVSDVEWPRYKHDMESAVEALEHALLNAS